MTCGLQATSHLLLIALSSCVSMILLQTIFFSSFFKPIIGQEVMPLSSLAVTFLTSWRGLLLSLHGQQEHPEAQVPPSCGHLRRNLGHGLAPDTSGGGMTHSSVSSGFSEENKAESGDQEGNGTLKLGISIREIARAAQGKGECRMAA